MTRFPLGLVLLVVLSLLVYLGVLHRVLDRMRLNDRAALLVLAAMVVGSFVDLPLPVPGVTAFVNVGGGLVPLGLAGYLLWRAGTPLERWRGILAGCVTALAGYAVGSILNRGLVEPGGRFQWLDALYVYPLVAGAVAYLVGRSRRAACVGAVLGVILFDVFYLVWLKLAGVRGVVAIGGAGALDAVVLSAVLAVLLAEVVGETRERLAGGPALAGRPRKLLASLRRPGARQEEGYRDGTPR
ncbi:MAG: DUF1614 domain-containing protein [Firmicutes bacterium]|nr:DUF1614 domain-containing protein [Bacillota bacterium]